MGATARQYLASLACGLAVATTAVCFTWLEPHMLKFTEPKSEIPMTTDDTSWLVASVEFGEVFITVPAGLLADRFGRKPVMLSIGPMCLISWILVFTTRSLPVLYLVRIIQGAAVAVAYTVAPMYIAEVSEPRIRGELSGHFQTMWYVGILFVYLTGPYLAYQNYILVCAVPAVIFFLTFAYMPESPYYLLMVNRVKAAGNALKWLRHSEHVEEEFDKISYSVGEDMKQKANWKDLIKTKKDRKAFYIVQLVCFIKYMNGMSAIVSYATATFAASSGAILGHSEMTICLGVILCVSTCGAAFISDSVGRRPLLIFSTFGSMIFNIIIGLYYYLATETKTDVSDYVWVMYLSVAGYCIVSNVGLGPLLQTIQAEFFPSHTRGIGSGITEVSASIATFLNLKQYQMVADRYGVYMNFWIFAVFGLLGTIVLYIVLPETAGKSLGQIQSEFSAPELEEDNKIGDKEKPIQTISQAVILTDENICTHL